MRNKLILTTVILSAFMSLFICPQVSGRIDKAGDYGAFAECDTWQKWVEHITDGDFKFTGFARYDGKECEELAAYVYDKFMTNAADDEYASDTTVNYAVPGYDESYDEEDRFDLYVDDEYNIEQYDSHAYYDNDEYSAADEYASFYNDEQPDIDSSNGAGEDEDYEAYEDDCDDYEDDYEDNYEDYPGHSEASPCYDEQPDMDRYYEADEDYEDDCEDYGDEYYEDCPSDYEADAYND